MAVPSKEPIRPLAKRTADHSDEITLRQHFEELLDVVRAKVDSNSAWVQDQLVIAEHSRASALDKAANTIQIGLDKAERALQVALDKAEKNLQIALEAAEKRVNEKFVTAKESSEKEWMAVNRQLQEFAKFRDQITAERALYITRDQMDLVFKTMSGELKPLQTQASWMLGRDAAILAVAGVLSGIIGVAIHFFSKG